MKTKQEMIELGYSNEWMVECTKCKSYNCHEYKDCILCYDCRHKEVKQ